MEYLEALSKEQTDENQVLQNMRNKYSSNSFYDTVAKMSTECDFIKDPINTRKRKSKNYSTMQPVDGITSEVQDFHPTTCQDCYQVMYYNVLDTVVRHNCRQVLLFTKISNPYYSKQSKAKTPMISPNEYIMTK